MRIEIDIKYNNERLRLSIKEDSIIEDYKRVFKAILIWLTFDMELINELFGDKDEM